MHTCIHAAMDDYFSKWTSNGWFPLNTMPSYPKTDIGRFETPPMFVCTYKLTIHMCIDTTHCARGDPNPYLRIHISIIYVHTYLFLLIYIYMYIYPMPSHQFTWNLTQRSWVFHVLRLGWSGSVFRLSARQYRRCLASLGHGSLRAHLAAGGGGGGGGGGGVPLGIGIQKGKLGGLVY